MLLASDHTIIVCSDGGAKEGAGSFGTVIAIEHENDAEGLTQNYTQNTIVGSARWICNSPSHLTESSPAGDGSLGKRMLLSF